MLRAALPWLTVAVAILAVGQSLYAAWDQSWTLDERVHLAWSARLLDEGEGERLSVERYNSKTPISIAYVLARRAAMALGVEQPRALRFAARLPGALSLALLIAAVFGMTRFLAGPPAAHVAALIVALDPNLVAHSSLVTVDAPFALATVLTLWAAVAVARAPGLLRGVGLGAALGLALATKFTAMLLVLGVAALPLFTSSPRRRLLAPGLLAAATAWLVVCGAYLSIGIGTRFGDMPPLQSFLGGLAALLPGLPSPLPEAFVTGLDISLASARQRDWNVVILGGLHPRGVWYYFLVCWLVKTPLSLLVAQHAGLVAGLRQGLLAAPAWRYLALNTVAALVFFSLFSRAQIGYRFVLMCVPLLASLAAPGLATLAGGRHGRWGAALLVSAALAANAAYLGNPLSFTNASVLPKHSAYRLIADSNLDWGQNREKIRGWLDSAPESVRFNPPHPLPGLNVFNVNRLAGVQDFEELRWLRENARPFGHWGHTHLLFDITNGLYDRFLESARRYRSGPDAERLCGERNDWRHYPPRSRVPFVRSDPPPPGRQRHSQVCVSTGMGADVGFRVLSGRADVGYQLESCQSLGVGRGAVIWFRLEPGVHALCVAETPNRREYLPYELSAVIIVRGHSAEIALPAESARAATTE